MNKFMQKLRSNEIAYGCHITVSEGHVSELIGNVGFDYLWIDGEHSALTLENIQSHLIACRAAGTSGLVRIPSVDPVRAKQILEMGPDGIIFPQVNSYEDALTAVRCCQYPPQGTRGFGPRRAIQFGLTPFAEYQKSLSENLAVMLQIEHIDGARAIDKMLTIEGADIFILGPCDLANSMGKIGDWDNPEVNRVIDEVFEKVHKAGKKIGASTFDYTAQTAALWKKRGADFVSLGADVEFMLRGAISTLNVLRNAAEA